MNWNLVAKSPLPFYFTGTRCFSSSNQLRMILSGLTDVRTHYAVTRDGQRLLVNKILDRGNAPLTVIVNWPSFLKR